MGQVNAMKTMTCKQMGGACDEKLQAETFEEMMEKSKKHGMDMFQKKDEAHLKVMQGVKEKMGNPEAMQAYMDEKRKAFDETPEDQ